MLLTTVGFEPTPFRTAMSDSELEVNPLHFPEHGALDRSAMLPVLGVN